MSDVTKSAGGAAVAGAMAGAAVGAGVTYGLAQEAEERIRVVLAEALETLRAEQARLIEELLAARHEAEAAVHEAAEVGRTAIDQAATEGGQTLDQSASEAREHLERTRDESLHQLSSRADAGLDALQDRQGDALEELGQATHGHLERVGHAVNDQLAAATQSLRAVEHEVKQTVDGLLSEGQDRLHGAVDALDHRLLDRAEGLGRDLAETAMRQLGHVDERAGLARQEMMDTHSRLVDEAREEEQRLRERRYRMRAAVEDVTQVLLSAVPQVGPYLANLADRIDPND